MSKTQFQHIDVHELLPQQPPFVMIDTLLWYDDVYTRTRLTVHDDNIMCDDSRCLSAYGLIENIAQTCAARMGYYNKYILHNAVRLGFIGAIRNLEIKRLPSVCETLDTEIEVVQDVMQMTLVNANVRVGNETIVSAEMKIAVK